MNKKIAMSALGYVIVLIIILGIVMIISAPMMADKYEKKEKTSPNFDRLSKFEDKNAGYDSSRDNYEERRRSEERHRSEVNNDYVSKSDLEQIENRFSSKFYDIERRISDVAEKSSSSEISDKYVCSIEGFLDSAGNVKEIGQDSNVDIRNQKIVFVCEYRR